MSSIAYDTLKAVTTSVYEQEIRRDMTKNEKVREYKDIVSKFDELIEGLSNFNDKIDARRFRDRANASIREYEFGFESEANVRSYVEFFVGFVSM